MFVNHVKCSVHTRQFVFAYTSLQNKFSCECTTILVLSFLFLFSNYGEEAPVDILLPLACFFIYLYLKHLSPQPSAQAFLLALSIWG